MNDYNMSIIFVRFESIQIEYAIFIKCIVVRTVRFFPCQESFRQIP